MKDIKHYLTEAKFDYSKGIIKFNDIDSIKLQKKYEYKEKVQTLHFLEDYLKEWFGKLTQFLNKNVPNIVKHIEKTNGNFPKKLSIELPSDLSGDLHLDWDVYWDDNKAHGTLQNVEIIVGRYCPSNLSNSRYYDAKSELESYKLPEKIKI